MKIAPGSYTFGQLFDLFEFDVNAEAGVEYESSGAGVDYRRVQIGGLGFDDLDDVLVVPDSAKELTLTLDGNVVSTADVE